MDLGTTIKTVRKAKNISQSDLASRVGISATALSSIETNASQPKRKTLHSICRELGVTKNYILIISLDIDEVPEDKKEIFKILLEPLKKVLLK